MAWNGHEYDLDFDGPYLRQESIDAFHDDPGLKSLHRGLARVVAGGRDSWRNEVVAFLYGLFNR